MNHRRLIYTLTPLLTLAILLVPQITFASGIGDAILEVLYIFVVSVFGMFVWFGAVLLNFGINQFVIGFGDVYNNSGIGVAVNNTWVIIRDFVNLGFIFGLVYIGLRMILDSNNANTRRWLANLIIAALLVNFSLFATKFVIDVSNKLATEIACAGLSYPQGKNTKPADKTGCGLNGGSDYRIDVGGALMARMGLTTIFSEPDDALPSDLSFGYIFGTAILFLVAAFVFASGGILLFIRFAVLNLYLVFSAAMFLSWVIPGIQDTMNSYWKGFLKRAFFAPIYLLMLYFSFKIIDGLQISIRGTGDGDTGTSFASPNWSKTLATASEANDPAGATLGTLPFFVLICIFMIASLVVAQKLGAEGASKALSIGKNLGNKATKSTVNATKRGAGMATAGAAGYVGRGTVGKLAYNKLNGEGSEAYKDKLSQSRFGRLKMAALKKTGEASFDARGIGGVGKKLGVGEAQKGGFAKQVKDRKDKADKYAGKDGLGFVDTKSKEGQDKVAAEKKKIEAAADAAKKQAEGGKSSYDEAGRMGGAKFKEETKGRQEALAKQQEDLKAKSDAGLLTDREKADLEGQIAAGQKDISQRQDGSAALDRTRGAFDANIAADNASKNYRGADEKERTRLRNEAEKARAALEATREREKAAFDARVKEAETMRTNAAKQAEAEVKYSRQRAYLKVQQEKRASRGRFGGAFVNPVSAGALGAAATGSLFGAGVVGLTAGVAIDNQAVYRDAIIKELDKKYGKGGVDQLEKDAEARRLKQLGKAIKEVDNEGSADKKKDTDNKEEPA